MESDQNLLAGGRYREGFIHQSLRPPSAESFAEVVDQIYAFPVFTEDFCGQLVQMAEASELWQTEYEIDEELQDHTDHTDHRNCLSLESLGLSDFYRTVVERHVYPLFSIIVPDWKPSKIHKPYILKYEFQAGMKGMELHSDDVPVAMIVYLNSAFSGGGTDFPLQKYRVDSRPPGHAVAYPGQPSHLHAGLPITAGVRYLLICDFA